MSRSKFTALEKFNLLKDYQQSGLPRATYARQHGIGQNTLRRWLMRYQRDGIEGLEEAKKNIHYSKELKHTVVFAYLNGEGTLEEVANKYGLRNSTQAKVWVDKYNGDKPLTASPSRKQVPTMRKKTTFEERIEVVEYVVKHKHSYTEAAEHFQVSYQQARSWVLKAKDGGYEVLVDNRGHHKDESELTDLDKANLRIRQLEAELKDKELVEQFAKKLLELQRKG
ncbi:helix-turn-helix domain-containing protein [Lapidilactobacillus bayanensis]|uniref:helix-turn-helix domain-containing protein n=1 Tax=Lapidilactobacillus bayanensis TaxID=2485998 RepID=UPI000F77E4B8|nr:helix-turn-helix domain-containing protein [Lapidilactobacillus bayanensis]